MATTFVKMRSGALDDVLAGAPEAFVKQEVEENLRGAMDSFQDMFLARRYHNEKHAIEANPNPFLRPWSAKWLGLSTLSPAFGKLPPEEKARIGFLTGRVDDFGRGCLEASDVPALASAVSAVIPRMAQRAREILKRRGLSPGTISVWEESGEKGRWSDSGLPFPNGSEPSSPEDQLIALRAYLGNLALLLPLAEKRGLGIRITGNRSGLNLDLIDIVGLREAIRAPDDTMLHDAIKTGLESLRKETAREASAWAKKIGLPAIAARNAPPETKVEFEGTDTVLVEYLSEACRWRINEGDGGPGSQFVDLDARDSATLLTVLKELEGGIIRPDILQRVASFSPLSEKEIAAVISGLSHSRAPGSRLAELAASVEPNDRLLVVKEGDA